jgi:hypothetical protein
MAYPFQQDKITIYGPKVDGTYVIEFKTAMGETLATSGSVQTSSTAVDWFHQRDAVHGTRGVVCIGYCDLLASNTPTIRRVTPRQYFEHSSMGQTAALA